MRAAIKKWGNSAAVRIPASVLETAHLECDELVEVREEAGRIVIEPVHRKEYSVTEMVKGITRKNVHSEVETGDAVGNEVW